MFRSRIGSSSSSSTTTASARKCQKCLQTGHSTFECKNPRPYQSRPTRSQAFSDPKTLKKLREQSESVRLPDELRKNGTADTILAKRALERKQEEKKGVRKATSTSEKRPLAREVQSDGGQREVDRYQALPLRRREVEAGRLFPEEGALLARHRRHRRHRRPLAGVSPGKDGEVQSAAKQRARLGLRKGLGLCHA